jgi:SAM-dependent methyltransferase
VRVVPNPFARYDESDDAHFYAFPRRVVHIEPGAIGALRSRYAELLPPGGAVLDLMSSWRSHLPDGFGPGGVGSVTGLGMSAPEMADNSQLDGYVVHDLNHDPSLPFDDAAFDAVVCAVSVQYLVRPVDVFRDATRVLRPDGPLIVSFSNRCFPTKAVALWLGADDAGHRQIVRAYLEGAGLESIVDEQLTTPDDPLYVVWGRRATTR